MLYFIIIFFLSILLYPGIGAAAVSFLLSLLRIEKNVSQNDRANAFFSHRIHFIFLLCFGLQAHLWATYLVYRIGVPIHLSFCGILGILFLLSRKWQRVSFFHIGQDLSSLLYRGISFHSTFFTCIILFLGLSIFWEDQSILTLWTNNFGDLPYHIALIQNFSFNSNTVVDYPVYPGHPLSYYFMFDFWTACLQLYPNSWRVFSLICLCQWIFCWSVVYSTLSYFCSGVLTYLILFGGGTYAICYSQFLKKMETGTASALLSHVFIDKGYPWTVFLSTIWVTQRVAIFGLCLFVPAICLCISAVQNLLDKKQNASNRVDSFLPISSLSAIIGMYVAIMSLSHFYFSIIGLLFLGFVYLYLIIEKNFLRYTVSRALVLLICVAFLSILPSAYIFSSKTSMLSFMQGWMPWKVSYLPLFDSLLGSILMWVSNGAALFIILFFVYLYAPRVYTFALLLLFLIFNFLKLSEWNWDGYKVFIVLYVIAVCVLATVRRPNIFDSLFVFILCMPAITEIIIVVTETKPIAVYTKDDLYQARLLRERTEDEVIISKPVHNSIVTLAGKQLYFGYPGWLSSHRIDYAAREKENTQMIDTPSCELIPRSDVDPKYVYFGKQIPQNASVPHDPLIPALSNVSDMCLLKKNNL